MREEEIVKRIDRYLKEKLTENEIDLLWEEFLNNPKHFELLKTEAIAREYFQQDNDKVKQPFPDGQINP